MIIPNTGKDKLGRDLQAPYNVIQYQLSLERQEKRNTTNLIISLEQLIQAR